MAWNARSNLPVGVTGFLSYDDWISGWKYGLVDSQQTHCGAMPFRSGQGLNAAKCLRGEDWAFIRSVQRTSGSLPEGYIWNFPGATRPQANVLHAELNKADLTNAYNWLKAWEAQNAFGNSLNQFIFAGWNLGGTNVPDYGLPHYQSEQQLYTKLKETIVAPFVVSMPNPANQTNLQLSTMQAMFADYKKLKCTVVGGSMTPAKFYGTWLARTPNPMIIQNTTFTGFATPGIALPPNQLIYLSADLYLRCEFKQTRVNAFGQTETKSWIICLMDIREQVEFENRENDNTRYFYNMDADPRGRISMQDVATMIANQLNVPLFWQSDWPDPSIEDPQWDPTSFTTVTANWAYYPCEQHWLVDY